MYKFAKRIEEMEEEVQKLKVLTDPFAISGIIAFAAGSPALEAYPFDIIREIANDVLQPNALGYAALKYGTDIGYDPLREVVRDHLLAPRGLEADMKNIMITTGGIQPITMIGELFIEPGDVILVENPSFVQTTMIYKMFEAKIVPVETDDYGMVMEDCEKKIKEYNPKLIYIVPTFQNPTGRTLPVDRRKKLAELASQYDVVVLEDDPYREIRYTGEDLPYIKQFDTTGNVILANSFSKIFAPGARVGYLVANDEIINNLRNVKLGLDTATNTIAQVFIAEFFKRGYYPKHRENLCNLYRHKRDTLCKAIDEYFPEGTKRSNPEGGYYCWVELPGGLNATELAKEINETLNICYGTGSIFFPEGNAPGTGSNTIRMNFSALPEEMITPNIKKLGDFFKSKM